MIDARALGDSVGGGRRVAAYGLAPRKGLGQNFLVDRNVLRLIVEAARLHRKTIPSWKSVPVSAC